MAMKNYSTIIIFLMGFVLAPNMAESASPSALPPAVDCSVLVLTMADCLSFVISGSMVQKPEGSCCSGLKTTLKTDAECLCKGWKNSAQLGITLNVSKALTLPAACHVFAPSVSDCGLNMSPDGSPAVSPTASSPSSDVATPPTGSGTTEVASPPPASSGSSVLAANSFGPVALGLLVAYFSLNILGVHFLFYRFQ